MVILYNVRDVTTRLTPFAPALGVLLMKRLILRILRPAAARVQPRAGFPIATCAYQRISFLPL